jgi:DNA-binding beta-propeller fold protein YncE
VLDYKRGSVECYEDGKPARRFDVAKSAPMGLAVGPDGAVWVAATAKNQVLKLNAKGEIVITVGRPGRGTGELLAPNAVGLDGAGNVYVAELKNFRIQKFDPEGKPQWVTGGRGKLPGQFAYVVGIAVEESGAFYVCDRAMGRVDAFDPQGTFVRTVLKDLDEPTSIHLTKTRELLVAETGKHRILVVDTEGRVTQTFGRKGRDPGAFASPSAAAGLGTKIYVADTGNRRIQVFER